MENDHLGLGQIIKNFRSIGRAADLLKEVKDIRDELNILKMALTHQKKVWNELHDIKLGENGLTGPAYIIHEIEEMDKMAARIQSAVSVWYLNSCTNRLNSPR